MVHLFHRGPLDLTSNLQKTQGAEEQVEHHCEETNGKSRMWNIRQESWPAIFKRTTSGQKKGMTNAD